MILAAVQRCTCTTHAVVARVRAACTGGLAAMLIVVCGPATCEVSATMPGRRAPARLPPCPPAEHDQDGWQRDCGEVLHHGAGRLGACVSRGGCRRGEHGMRRGPHSACGPAAQLLLEAGGAGGSRAPARPSTEMCGGMRCLQGSATPCALTCTHTMVWPRGANKQTTITTTPPATHHHLAMPPPPLCLPPDPAGM